MANGKNNNNEQLAFVHENNDYQFKAHKAFNYVMERRKKHQSKVTLSFAPKNKMVPLQAADVLAFEANKRARDQSKPKRRSLIAMDPTESNIHMGVIDKKNVSKLIRKIEIAQKEISVFGRPIEFLD